MSAVNAEGSVLGTGLGPTKAVPRERGVIPYRAGVVRGRWLKR